MEPDIIHGDLLDQKVDVIINTWNRNVIPWWLLLPQGVSGSIKRQAGIQPFVELARYGPIPLGGAVVTCPGCLPQEAIIHVAGINMFWMASRRSIRDSVLNAMSLVNEAGYSSAAFPVIGAGSGSYHREKALAIMRETFEEIETKARIVIVCYRKQSLSAR